MEGGLGGCFTSIWLSNERAEMNALAYAIDEMNDVFQIADRSEGRFRVCRTVPEIRTAWDEDAFASVFMLEGADPISWSLKELRIFYELGMRLLAPCWSRSTIFAHGVAFGGSLPETGLTDLGRQLVRRVRPAGDHPGRFAHQSGGLLGPDPRFEESDRGQPFEREGHLAARA